MKPTFTAITFFMDEIRKAEGYPSERIALQYLYQNLPKSYGAPLEIPVQVWRHQDGEAPLMVSDLLMNRKNGRTRERGGYAAYNLSPEGRAARSARRKTNV